MAATPITTTEELLLPAVAAHLIGIHPNTLRGYADKQLIPHIRLPGGHRRFRRSDIDAFIARLQDHTIAEPTEEQMAALLREHGE